MPRFIHTIFLSLALLSTGCATLSQSTRTEPRDIVVRNRSNIDFASVVLSAPITHTNTTARFGQLAPVPRGSSQVYGRPTNPPPLADSFELILSDANDQEYRQMLQIGELLQSKNDLHTPMALVLEILPTLEIRVYLEAAR